MPVVPFNKKQPSVPEASQVDPNFLLMAAGMMKKEAEAKAKPTEADRLRDMKKRMFFQDHKGTPEDEFKAPAGIENEPDSPYNDVEGLRNTIMKLTPKERSI